MLGFVITLILLFFIWFENGLKAVDTSDKTNRIFVVAKGGGVREIANKLKKEGFIKDSVVFFLLIRKLGLDGKIQAGDFRLSPSMNVTEIAESLTHGTLDIWVTIPEGKRVDELADILKEKIPTYTPLWKTKLQNFEGYLFPDTYLIPKDADIDLIISIMRNNFEKKFVQIKINRSHNLTKNDLVILASLIEREAKHAQDRPLVSSVLVNRLNIGMPLQIDATVQYALGYQLEQKSWWKKDLTTADLKINSQFNTYQNVGLPPTPIANPGLATLEAAANPSETDYLYYISDKNGFLHFAKTLEEHNNNIKKYGL